MSHKEMPVYAQTRNPTGGPELTGKTVHRDPWEGIMEEEKGGPGWPKRQHVSFEFRALPRVSADK